MDPNIKGPLPGAQPPPHPQLYPSGAPPPYAPQGSPAVIPMANQALPPQQWTGPPPVPQGSPAVIPMANPAPPPHQWTSPPPVMAAPALSVTVAAPPVVVTQPAVVNTVVIANSTTVLGRGPANITCPTCRLNVNTNVNKSLKAEAWICCVILCLFGCELCFWIPFVMDSNYKVEHSCPNCRSFVGCGN